MGLRRNCGVGSRRMGACCSQRLATLRIIAMKETLKWFLRKAGLMALGKGWGQSFVSLTAFHEIALRENRAGQR